MEGMPSLSDILAAANLTVGDTSASFYADAMGFVHAIDWSERWLLGLLALHLVIWVLAISLRQSHDMQMVLLVVIRTCRCDVPATLSHDETPHRKPALDPPSLSA